MPLNNIQASDYIQISNTQHGVTNELLSLDVHTEQWTADFKYYTFLRPAEIFSWLITSFYLNILQNSHKLLMNLKLQNKYKAVNSTSNKSLHS